MRNITYILTLAHPPTHTHTHTHAHTHPHTHMHTHTQESHPIRTIDLRDVLDVSADDSQGQQNCIKVITSYRTFFMYASSAQEAEEWIKILRWKLVRVCMCACVCVVHGYKLIDHYTCRKPQVVKLNVPS